MTCRACGAPTKVFRSSRRHAKYCDSCNSEMCPDCQGRKSKGFAKCNGCRDRSGPPKTVGCAWCGEVIEDKRPWVHRDKFCSLACRSRGINVGRGNAGGPRTVVYLNTCTCGGRFYTSRRGIRHCSEICREYDAGEPPRRTQRSCLVCSKAFLASDGRKRTCSKACAKESKRINTRRSRENNPDARRSQRQRRRARLRRSASERFSVTEIFRRDGWRCGICGGKTLPAARVPHPKSATLDHIVPLSKGGSHTRVNVQCAHFSCNSMKGDRSVGSQLLLVG